MTLHKFIFVISTLSLISCANTPKPAKSVEPTEVSDSQEKQKSMTATAAPTKSAGFLICKAKKSRFHYDWRVGSLASDGQELVDQNSIRYEFRSANRPAGDKGQHLKVGECGWAEKPLIATKAKKGRGVPKKSQVTFKSLSDEATQNFYKLKTGKVFTVPVRQTKNGMVAAPGSGISLVR